MPRVLDQRWWGKNGYLNLANLRTLQWFSRRYPQVPIGYLSDTVISSDISTTHHNLATKMRVFARYRSQGAFGGQMVVHLKKGGNLKNVHEMTSGRGPSGANCSMFLSDAQ